MKTFVAWVAVASVLSIAFCGCVNTQLTRTPEKGFALKRKALLNTIQAGKLTWERDTNGMERLIIEGPISDSTKALETIQSALELLKSAAK